MKKSWLVPHLRTILFLEPSNSSLLPRKVDGKIKKSVMLLLAFSVVMGVLLMPAMSAADPGNGNGNGIGNGNADGWDNGNGNDNDNSSVQQIPEPFSLLLVGSGLVGLAIIRKRLR